jgi:hypothetical protein
MSLPLTVLTTRLELIAAAAETVSLELHNIEQLATALDVPFPSSWPPPLNDEGSQRWYLEMLQHHASAVGWACQNSHLSFHLFHRETTPGVFGVLSSERSPRHLSFCGSCRFEYSGLR